MVNLTPVEVFDAQSIPTAVIRAENYPFDRLREFMDGAYGALGAAVTQGNFQPTGASFSLYDTAPTATVNIETGFPLASELSEPIPAGELTVIPSVLPSGTVAKTSYTGSYDRLGRAWGEFMAQIDRAGFQSTGCLWESYVTMPTPDARPEDMVTELFAVVAPK